MLLLVLYLGRVIGAYTHAYSYFFYRPFSRKNYLDAIVTIQVLTVSSDKTN